jgi:hypothetical protein
MSDNVNDHEMVEELVAVLRDRLLEAYRAGKQPKAKGLVKREPDGSWELRISVPPDSTVGK